MKKVIKKKVKKEKKDEKVLIKILKETPVKYVKWDLEMDPKLELYLYEYAKTTMPEEVKKDLFIEWAVVTLLKNLVDEGKREILETNK